MYIERIRYQQSTPTSQRSAEQIQREERKTLIADAVTLERDRQRREQNQQPQEEANSGEHKQQAVDLPKAVVEAETGALDVVA